MFLISSGIFSGAASCCFWDRMLESPKREARVRSSLRGFKGWTENRLGKKKHEREIKVAFMYED